jgi:hypothetical protein
MQDEAEPVLYPPAWHSRQPDRPDMLVYVPASQAVHAVLPDPVPYVPVAHDVQALAPVPLAYVPAPQAPHAKAKLVPTYLPLSHARHDDTPAPVAYWPGPQPAHTEPFCLYPAPHRQPDRPDPAGENELAGQPVQFCAPAELYVPGRQATQVVACAPELYVPTAQGPHPDTPDPVEKLPD